MKKALLSIAAFVLIFGTLGFTNIASATITPINISTPDAGINPKADIGKVFGNAITIIFVLAALAVLFMLIIGAFQWIMSGGEKEAVNKARGRITNALIGLVILALAFLVVRLVGAIVNVNVLQLNLPSLDNNAV